MKDIKDIPVICDFAYGVEIQGTLYQPTLDGLLIVGSIVNRDRSFILSSWQKFGFSFKCGWLTANQMNDLWRRISRALELVDKHWTVVYTESMIECSYELDKMF